MPKFVVDTHALIWFLSDNPRLGRNALTVLNDPTSQLVLPAIALAEALWILSSKRLGVNTEDLLAAIAADSRIYVYPLTQEIVEEAQSLEVIAEMHDRQIVATALHLSTKNDKCSLLSRDLNISESGLISIIW